MRFGDLISLTFCTGSGVPQQFREWTVQLAARDARVTVTPDLFGGILIPVEVRVCELARSSIASDNELLDEIRRWPAVTLTGHVAGP